MATLNCIHASAGPQLLSGLFTLLARARREHAIRRTARALVLLNRRRLESLGLDHGEPASAGRTRRDLS